MKDNLAARSQWREFAFAFHQAQQAIMPKVSLIDIIGNWQEVALDLAEDDQRDRRHLRRTAAIAIGA